MTYSTKQSKPLMKDSVSVFTMLKIIQFKHIHLTNKLHFN